MLICGNLVTSINHNQKILCGCLHCKLYESHAVKNYHALIFFLIFTLKFLTHYKSTMYDQTWGNVKGQICNWLFHLYVCSILVDKTKKNSNDLPTISSVLTWWLNDVLTTCIKRTVKLAGRPITPPLIICYKDINFSPG